MNFIQSYKVGPLAVVSRGYNPSLPESSKYLVSRCLEPQKAEPQEVFGDPNTYSQHIWKTRVSPFIGSFLGVITPVTHF